MKTAANVIGVLGILISVMAASSLITDMANSSLAPYLTGILGNILELYQLARTKFFAELGYLTSSAVNLAAKYVTFLPKAPWFSIAQWQEDAATLYTICGSALAATMKVELGKQQIRAVVSIVIIIGWPLFFVGFIQGVMESEQERKRKGMTGRVIRRVLLKWLYFISMVIFGTGVFFALIYAENKIGF